MNIGISTHRKKHLSQFSNLYKKSSFASFDKPIDKLIPSTNYVDDTPLKTNKETNLPDSCDSDFTSGIKIHNKAKSKILVVDDSELMRKSVVKIFRNIPNFNDNFELLEGDDGIDILKIIMDDQREGNTILGIVSDENMSYLQGSKAFFILREFEEQHKIKPVKKITLTAFSDEASLVEMKNNGSDQVYNKPLSKNDAKLILSQITN
jgi:CheY-like chemotaxis protein